MVAMARMFTDPVMLRGWDLLDESTARCRPRSFASTRNCGASCSDVIPDHGSLLIVEPVLPATVPPDRQDNVYPSDLNMLVNVGGRERTADDFAALCTAGGFALRSVTPLPAPHIFQIVEASPV